MQHVFGVRVVICHSAALLRGFAKLNKFQKSKINLDRAHPTHPPPIHTFFFRNPSLTWTEHSNHNNQQLLAMCVHTELQYTWYTNPKYQYWFLFWDDFPHKQKFQVRPGPIHFLSNLGFLEFCFVCKAPKYLYYFFHCSMLLVFSLQFSSLCFFTRL